MPRSGTQRRPADALDSADLARRLLAWYDRHRRVLPWRALPHETPDPYRVWLAEIMLQQTTVATVGPYFRDFLTRWPTVRDLAAASLDDVLAAWAGLGYYARARNLHKCARHVAATLAGRFPDSEDALRELPSIGAYTAAAVAAIAFDRPAVVIDGNIERVLTRLAVIATPLPAAKKDIRIIAAKLSPAERAGDYAQALMDLGATICTPRHPRCMLCPWQTSCAAFAAGTPERFPVRAPKTERPTRRGVAFVLLGDKDKRVWLRRRPESGLLGGMLEVPSTPWRAARWQEAEARRHVPTAGKWADASAHVRHVFTHFALELDVWTARANGRIPDDGQWYRLDALGQLALPTLTHKVLEAALQPPRQSVKPRARPRIMAK